jgi:hypothetical protein
MADAGKKLLPILGRGLAAYLVCTFVFYLFGPQIFNSLLPVVRAEFLIFKPKYENLELRIVEEPSPALILTAKVNVPVIRDGKPYPYLNVRQPYSIQDLIVLTLVCALPMTGRSRCKCLILALILLLGLALVEIPSKFLHHTYIRNPVDRFISWISAWYWDYFATTGGRQILSLALGLALWFPFRIKKHIQHKT